MVGTIILALGLVLIIEGLAYALAPSLVERMLEALRAMPLAARRMMGQLAILAGVALLWLAGYLGAF
jgi:uncharacterized protein YjeT (DUF2065 family)